MKRWNSVRRLLKGSQLQPTCLVVGLGNPGPDYHLTRHNLGFRVCEELVGDSLTKWTKTSYRANLWFGDIEGRPTALLRPRTFVNKSGPVVASAIQEFSLDPSKIILVHDDIDMSFGRIRLRSEGSAGGHNGVKSIIQALRTDAIARVKIGVGRPPEGVDPSTYVLDEFEADEQVLVEKAIQQAAAAVRTVLTKDIQIAMRTFNVNDVADRPS